jgi:hypothetical protein
MKHVQKFEKFNNLSINNKGLKSKEYLIENLRGLISKSNKSKEDLESIAIIENLLEESLRSRIMGAFKGALYPTRDKMEQAFLHFNKAWTKNGTLKIGLSKQSLTKLLDEAEADDFAGKPSVKDGKMAYLKGMDMTAKSGTSHGRSGGTAG